MVRFSFPAAGQRKVGCTVSNVGYACNYWTALYRFPYGDFGTCWIGEFK